MHLHACGGIHQGISKRAFDGYIENSGILQYAVSNDLIVIFPQAEFSLYWGNTFPCFASNIFLGKEKENQYLTKESHQMKALKAMLDRGLEERNDFRSTNLWTEDMKHLNKTYYPVFMMLEISYIIENSWLFITNLQDFLLRPITWGW